MVSTRLKYFIRILLGILLGIYLGMIVLLSIPYVQGRLSAFVSKELRSLLNTEVSMGKIDMGLLNRIIVEDVLLHDHDGDELLKVARLSAKFELLPLLKGRIAISSVQLFGFNIRMAKDTPEAVPNFQFVLDAFASKDTTDNPTRLDLRINSVLIRRGRISYHVLSEPETPGKFNANHLAVKNLSATLSLKALTPDSLNAAIRRFSFEEQSGFALKKLTVKMVANHNRLDIKDFDIELPETALRMDSLTLTYDSIQGLAHMEEGTASSGALRGSVVLKDFAPFVPSLGRMEEPLYVTADFSTHGKNLDCPSLRIANRNQSLLVAGEAALSNWDAGKNMYIYGKLANLTLTHTSIEGIMSGLTGKVPAIVQRIGNVRCRGEAAGYLHDLTLTGTLDTDAGTLRTDVMMSENPDRGIRTYSGSVASSDLNVGRLLGKEDQFGKADFNVELSGFNYEGHYPESYIKGIVATLEYSGYRYENILLDGVYKDGGFNGKLALDDENGSVQIDGSFNTEQAVPDFNLKAVVKNLRPHDLHLTDRYEDADLSLSLTADFTGNSIDDMNGRISLDSLLLNAPDGRGYFLDNLTVTAGQVDGKKELRITSPFLTGVVRGDYSYHTVPASVVQTVQRYIPSLLSVNDLPRPHNNFGFDIRMEDSEILDKLFGLPLTLHLPVTLKGYFNDTEEKLRVEGHFPGFSYNGTHYNSGVLLCENPSDRFKCSLRGTMLLKSGAMLNLSAEGDAKDDMLSTTVNWGNNTDVTYGGKFAARTRFFKTEGNRPLLQANIDIQPTEVVLNDTVWHIHPSHIAVDSGRVFVDNFLFEHENQHLKIDGRFTAKETDSCLVDLKNIRLDYVLDIVRFDDVAFGGLITGRVNLKSVMKDPVMQTRLKVHDFRLNHALLGDADIIGTWDKELGGVRLDAQIEEAGGVSATHATGYVSPKLKGLDLSIRARRTNIGFLQPFIDGIFSDMEGRIDGQVRLYGDFKHLDLEGEVKGSLETKIDALNTFLQIREDSIHIASGSIDFRNVKIYDREGHEGTVNGYLHHTKLKNLMYHFNIQGNNLLMYDTHEPGDMSFYGRVYGTGNVVLNGGNNAMTVDASLTTGRNTTFTYITGVTTEAASNQFITFVDKTPKRIQDDVETHLYHHSNAQEEEEEEGPPMDLRINMLIDATPDASMKIIMDPVAGDNITATGRGTLQVNYFNKGDFRMFGSYVIDQGLYKLSMQEVIRKDFTLNSGGTVTFTGDPYEANLDVQAIYTVNSASLSDLVVDQSRSQNTVKVNCLMNLTGNLSNPDIKFDLELPTVREEDRELVRSVTATEEQMNTQIIYLLGIGKFYTYDYANDQSSNATSSLAFNTLSGQLNNMLSQWMANKNWNIGANLSTGEKGWTDVEAEAILSGRLLNNRLIINGNFGYKENVMANSNFVGDFEAIWLLTPNGDFRLRGYNQTNDRYFIKSTLTTQGIGIMYKKDFNTWDDLFRWFAWKRRSKRNQNTYK